MITFENVPISDYSDSELVRQIQSSVKDLGKNKLQSDIAGLWSTIYRIFDDVGTPASVRQIFYQCDVRGAVPKTEASYRKVQKQTRNMRKCGMLPYHFIGDNTRWMRKPTTYKSIESFVNKHAQTYRRDLWDDQPAYVEIWIEKDALVGVVEPITAQYDVPLYSTKGYSSLTLTYNASEYIKEQTKAGKECFVYYFGDYDPEGVTIDKSVKKHMEELDAYFNFERIAVNREQIEEWDLPTRPTKFYTKTGKINRRAINFDKVSVELDAIRPDMLRGLVRNVIEQHIDKRILEKTIKIEELEKNTLMNTFGKLCTSTQFSGEVHS